MRFIHANQKSNNKLLSVEPLKSLPWKMKYVTQVFAFHKSWRIVSYILKVYNWDKVGGKNESFHWRVWFRLLFFLQHNEAVVNGGNDLLQLFKFLCTGYTDISSFLLQCEIGSIPCHFVRPISVWLHPLDTTLTKALEAI